MGLVDSKGKPTSEDAAIMLAKLKEYSTLEAVSDGDNRNKLFEIAAHLEEMRKRFVLGMTTDKNLRSMVYVPTARDMISQSTNEVLLRSPISATPAARVFVRDSFQCQRCNDTELYRNGHLNQQLDHKIPLWVWRVMSINERMANKIVNPHGVGNLQLLCQRCHREKGQDDISKWNSFLGRYDDNGEVIVELTEKDN